MDFGLETSVRAGLSQIHLFVLMIELINYENDPAGCNTQACDSYHFYRT